MKAQGAPIKTMGFYNVRKMRRGNAWSTHAYAASGDIDDKAAFSSAMQKWIADHPNEWNETLKKHNLSQPYPGWDAPHIEWAGPLSDAQLAANRAAIDRAAVDRAVAPQ